jgi:hypothetical protein
VVGGDELSFGTREQEITERVATHRDHCAGSGQSGAARRGTKDNAGVIVQGACDDAPWSQPASWKGA